MSKSIFLDGDGDFHNWIHSKNQQTISYKGTFDLSASYKKSDIVLDQGASYICLQDSVGNLTSSTSYWGLMAQKGGSTTLDDLGSTSTTTTYSASKIESSLNSKANIVHTHAISDVTNLQSTLDGKALAIHTHALSNITDIDATNKTNGYTLQYDSTVSKFVSKALPTGSGTGATNMSGLSDVDVTTTVPVNDNVLTFESGKWIPKLPSITGSSLGSYTLELSRWGITNTISDASSVTISTNNSNGINNALSWASAQGYTDVIFPLGSYLINETIPVAPQSFQTINLNGSTLRIRNNALTKYGVIIFQNSQMFSRVTNGKIQGDRYDHDYYYWNNALDTGVAWTKWLPNHTYTVGNKVMPTNVLADNYKVYWQCTSVSATPTSGATEPIWNANQNGTTSDSGVTWTAYARHTHEWGYGISVGWFDPPSYTGCNARFISLDNLELFELTGDGVSHQYVFNQTYFSDNSTYPVFEQGNIYIGEAATVNTPWGTGTSYSINAIVLAGGNIYKCTTAGAGASTITPSGTSTSAVSNADGYSWIYKGTLGGLVADATRIRTTNTILMSNSLITKWKYFGIYGDSYGNLGTAITATLFDVVFYNSDNSFNSAVANVQFFDEINIPSGSSYAKLVMHQSAAPSGSNSASLHVSEFPKFVYTEKCNIHDCRRLAISITGGKHIYIRGNDLHHISGTGPAGSIDIEDGYRMNQFVHIEDNSMHNTSSGVTLAGGRYITIKNNRITDNLTVWNNVDQTIIDGNIFTTNSRHSLAGEIIYSNNRLYGCSVSLGTLNNNDRQGVIDNCTFYNSSLSIGKGVAHYAEVKNCKFYTDSEYYNNPLFQGFGAVLILTGSQAQTITNCVFSGSGTKGSSYISIPSTLSEPWIMNNVSFINMKHTDNITSTLPPAIYSGCKFVNSGTISAFNGNTATGKYEFNDCYFQWDGYNQYGTASTVNVASLSFRNCYFSGGSSTAIYLWTLGGKLTLINNIFDYPSSTGTGNIIALMSSFNPESVLVSGNRFKSNQAMVVMDATSSTFSSTNIIFKDNILDTVIVKLQGTHTRRNNYINGILDPYFTVSATPTTGYYALGQQLLNSAPTSGGYIGWICTTAGTANTTAWATTTAYTVGQVVNANGKVYSCTVAGTSGSTAPSHTTGTATDGTVTWQYVDILAVFKQFGAIAAT